MHIIQVCSLHTFNPFLFLPDPLHLLLHVSSVVIVLSCIIYLQGWLKAGSPEWPGIWESSLTFATCGSAGLPVGVCPLRALKHLSRSASPKAGIYHLPTATRDKGHQGWQSLLFQLHCTLQGH